MTYPFVCGRYADVMATDICSCSHNCFTSLLLNSRPWSCRRTSKAPKRNTSFIRNLWTFWAVFCSTALTSAHLVTYSVATKMYFLPRVVSFKGPMKSIPQRWKTCDTLMACNVTGGCLLEGLAFWHRGQFRKISLTATEIPSHQNRSLILRIVALWPKWPPPIYLHGWFQWDESSLHSLQ